MSEYRIELRSSDQAVSKAAAFLDEVLNQKGVPQGIEETIQLVAEEAIVNVITHGYKDTSGFIRVLCDIESREITLSICDDAPVFNPLLVPPPDIDADLDERRIGGLGVHLIRSLMDEVRYEETKAGNCLIMIKRISP